jgi:hypothetical protein
LIKIKNCYFSLFQIYDTIRFFSNRSEKPPGRMQVNFYSLYVCIIHKDNIYLIVISMKCVQAIQEAAILNPQNNKTKIQRPVTSPLVKGRHNLLFYLFLLAIACFFIFASPAQAASGPAAPQPGLPGDHIPDRSMPDGHFYPGGITRDPIRGPDAGMLAGAGT